MSHTPRQTIIDFLSAPIASSAQPLTLTGDETTQRGIHSTSGGLAAIPSTIHFLKEREVPHFYACIVTFNDRKGQQWEMVCLAQQDEQGNWILRNGSGGAPHTPSPTTTDNEQVTHVELRGGPGTEGGFYAGGYIIGANAHNVRLVQLVDGTGKTLEDTVDDGNDGRVLFVTEQDMQAPIRIKIL